MDVEFHYYMTYLIATKAGFNKNEAYTLAYSSQYVDDNDIIFEINKDGAEYYSNYISQTMNILKPKSKLMRIYPLFHFIPGEHDSITARRKDGKFHLLNTTPNSENANLIFDEVLKSEDLYKIGIATHSFVDTWAHQNFIGYFDDFNAMKGLLQSVSPNIGHADAGHNPDWPALIWRDKRLLGRGERVDNKERFLEASGALFEKLLKLTKPDIKPETKEKEKNKLLQDLAKAIGERDQSNKNQKARIAKYIKLSTNKAYGGSKLIQFDVDEWFDEVVNEDVRGLKDFSDFTLAKYDPFTDIYTWKDEENYKESNWYRFQEAVKSYQDIALGILNERVFNKMDLKEL